MKTRRRVLFAVCLLLLVALGFGLRSLFSRPSPVDLPIATATRGGTYFPLGTHLAGILEDLPGNPVARSFAWETSGSNENLDLLTRPRHAYETKPAFGKPRPVDSADLAIVANTALADWLASRPAEKDGISALASLYTGVVQVVVPRHSGISGIRDLRGKRVYTGRDRSGTKPIAVGVLRAGGALGAEESPPGTDFGYLEAAKKLLAGDLDAAIYASGTPTVAVKHLLRSGRCRLLDLGGHREEIKRLVPGLADMDLPANYYENQAYEIASVGARAILVCRSTLSPKLVERVVGALFDNSTDLLLGHSKAQDIRLDRAFQIDVPGIDLHPGVARFRANEEGKLLISTGAIGGAYHQTGEMIQTLLNQAGFSARAIHTDGSLENARLLREVPSLAILQYDIALASRMRRTVYKDGVRDGAGRPLQVTGMRRIATLHEEKLYVLALRERLPTGWTPTLRDLEGLIVCVGPENSGTQVLADAVLDAHEVKRAARRYLPVHDMIDRLHAGEIHAGFLVSGMPSIALRRLLDDRRFRLVSLDRRRTEALSRSAALIPAEIPAGRFACQKASEPAVDTLATTAVLVTTEDLPFDVERITRALFEGAAFLGIEGVERRMARKLPSLPLHPDAEEAYRDMKLIPSPRIGVLEVLAHLLAILVILFGSLKGGLMLMREHIESGIKGEILKLSSEESEHESVRRLGEIREEVRERARRHWWQPGGLDKSRWRDLEEMIDHRVTRAKSTLMKRLFRGIRGLSERDGELKAEGAASLRRRLWSHAEEGDLNELQIVVLLRALDDAASQS